MYGMVYHRPGEGNPDKDCVLVSDIHFNSHVSGSNLLSDSENDFRTG